MRIKLLCPECGVMREIKEGSIRDAKVTLQCGHERPTAALPLAPGRVSLENVSDAAFPVITQDDTDPEASLGLTEEEKRTK